MRRCGEAAAAAPASTSATPRTGLSFQDSALRPTVAPPLLPSQPQGPLTPGGQDAHVILEPDTGTPGSRHHAPTPSPGKGNGPQMPLPVSVFGGACGACGAPDPHRPMSLSSLLGEGARGQTPTGQTPSAPGPTQTWRPPGSRASASRARPAGHRPPALSPASRPWSRPRCPGQLCTLRGEDGGPISRLGCDSHVTPPGKRQRGAHGIPKEIRLMAV